jgi:hypothetical protein
MVMTNLSSAVLFTATLGLAGCYDASTVNPYPKEWLIDDFEDLNEFPFDHSFERWGCRPLDAEHPIAADGCNRVPDSGSSDKDPSYVLHLGAALYPPMGDNDTFTRAEVGTYVHDARLLDFRPYLGSHGSFRFSSKLVLKSGAADSLSGSSLYLKAELWCTSARRVDVDGGLPNKPFVVKSREYTVVDLINFTDAPQWIPNDLSDFGTPELSNNAPDVQDCLARVDGIKITLDSNGKVQPNHEVKFDLFVDDISLQPKE